MTDEISTLAKPRDPVGVAVTNLRKDLGLTMEDFAPRVGLSSKGAVSVIEQTGRCSPEVALAIERLSRHRIDAAKLNDLIAKARGAAKAA